MVIAMPAIDPVESVFAGKILCRVESRRYFIGCAADTLFQNESVSEDGRVGAAALPFPKFTQTEGIHSMQDMQEANQAAKERLLAEQRFQKQFEELKERATKDALSGLLNRMTVEQYIEKRLAAMRPEEVCALMIVDLDNFKQVNDTLGHQAGDQAIRHCARILSGIFRASDIVGRLGGDEFVIFLTGALTEELIREKGETICKKLQIVLGDDPHVALTASAGACLASGSGVTFEELYHAADQALYTAKRAGRNSFYISRGADGKPSAKEQYNPVNTISITGLLESMDSGVALLEMGEVLRLIYVSPSFYRIIGVQPAAYNLPLPLSELIHPDDLLEVERVLREGLERKQTVDHIHRVSAGGARWAWWHIRAVRVEYDSPYPVMLVTTTDISRFKENEHRLQEINERLQTAFDQTTQHLWEVDIPDRTFRLFDREGGTGASGPSKSFPDALIADGWIHPNSVPRFREFAQELLGGRVQDYGNFIIQFQDTGCYGWAALSYRMLLDEAGQPLKAVGIIEALPQNFVGQEARSSHQRPLPEALAPDLIVGMRANLTQDTIRELWSEGKDLSGRAREWTCAHILRTEAAKLFSEDDRRDFARYFDRDALLALYEDGQRWLSAEYRRIDGGGNIRWVGQVINLTEDPLSQDVYLFFYLIQLDRRHRWEAVLGGEIGRDPVTRLYDRRTTRALVEALIGRGGEDCAMALVRLGGLIKRFANDPAVMNQTRSDIAAALSVSLGSSCVVGQYSTDQVLIFFPRARTRLSLRNQLEETFTFVRMTLGASLPMGTLRFVAGMSCMPASEASYGAMLTQASNLCQLWQNAAADTVAFPHEDDDWTWTELQTSGEDDRVTVHHAEMRRPLSDGEKDVAFDCVSSMLSADSLETSIGSVLSYIGTYYHADRVYILVLAENRHVVTMPYEWTDKRRHSIQQTVSGMLLDRFPLLKRCMEEQAPVFLTRTRPLMADGETIDPGPWYFTAFPLVEREEVRGFLCVENSREHPADAALFSTLIPHILRERKRFQAGGVLPGNGAIQRLVELPNLRTYMERIYSFNSDSLSSLGAVCLDIPHLATINSSLGFEYGSRLLWCVSKTLTDIFGPELLFRTWDAEFVALCPNTTYQVFVGRCNRLRFNLQRRYPRTLRLGHTWADGVFTGKNLVDEARTMMRCEQDALNPYSMAAGGDDAAQSGEAAPEGGQFTVYLQPKIDMRSGALCGAEALARWVREDGTVMSPGQFVEEMERSGTIRELDLFVLNRTLAILDKWREDGLGIVPISVNFSRLTLFSPSALASVLAIQSRYPQIPPDTLELEVTEGAVHVEASKFQGVIDRFREHGIRLSLDDFGSQYANISVFANVRFDTVKLDRSLIAKLAGNAINQMLVRDIVRICQTNGMRCIAEGVETAAQIAALQEAGCRYAQGYYFDRPLPAEQFEEKYLRDRVPQRVTE